MALKLKRDNFLNTSNTIISLNLINMSNLSKKGSKSESKAEVL